MKPKSIRTCKLAAIMGVQWTAQRGEGRGVILQRCCSDCNLFQHDNVEVESSETAFAVLLHSAQLKRY